MNIDDGRVLAVSGAMLADGEFHFDGADAHEFLRPASSMIEVRSRSGRLGTGFGFVGNARAMPTVCGLPTGRCTPNVPDDIATDRPAAGFSHLRIVARRVPSNLVQFELSAKHSNFARIAVDTVFGQEGHRDSLFGQERTLAIQVRRTAEAFKFAIETRVDEPRRGKAPAAPFTARVTAEPKYGVPPARSSVSTCPDWS